MRVGKVVAPPGMWLEYFKTEFIPQDFKSSRVQVLAIKSSSIFKPIQIIFSPGLQPIKPFIFEVP